MADGLFHQRVTGAKNLLIFSLGKDNVFGIGLRLVDHRARDFVSVAQSTLELCAIGLEIERFSRDAAAHCGFGHGRGLPHQHARIEGFGNQVLAPELQPRDAIGAANGIRNVFLGQVGQRLRGCQLHLFVDGGGAHVERPSENERESQNIVDLVGIIRAPGGNDHIRSAGFGFFISDFRSKSRADVSVFANF